MCHTSPSSRSRSRCFITKREWACCKSPKIQKLLSGAIEAQSFGKKYYVRKQAINSVIYIHHYAIYLQSVVVGVHKVQKI